MMTEQAREPAPERHPHPARKARAHCAICGREAHNPIAFATIRPSMAALITAEHPNVTPQDVVCLSHLIDYRTRHVEHLLAREKGELSDLEREVVESLAREETVSQNIQAQWEDTRSFGERLADAVADFGGSWNFIVSFSLVILVWMAFNLFTAQRAIFDPFPFILLNLVLSCIAAAQAPIIMMSQKRQEAKYRLQSDNDYRVNLKAELEIRHLHEKIDHLINRQWERLAEIQQVQLEILQDLAAGRR